MLGTLFLFAACEPFGPGDNDTGGPPPREGRLVVLPAVVDFGSLSVLQDGTASHTVIARNTGEQTLVVAGLDRVVGEEVVFTTDAPALVDLDENEVLDIQVTFAPTTHASWEAWLVPNGEQLVKFTGTGVAPVAILTPEIVDFGFRPIHCELRQIAELANQGEEPLEIVSVEVSAGFSLVDSPSDSVEAGGTVTLEIVASPLAGGAYEGVLQVESNDPENPVVVSSLTLLAYEDPDEACELP
jgi:hypothetical protein